MAVTALGGLVKGLTGFGYALVSTGILLTFLPPESAVGLMIVPLIAANAEVLNELTWTELKKCATSFQYYLIPLLAGAVTGTSAAGVLPGDFVSAAIGLMVLIYAMDRLVGDSLQKFADYCFSHGTTVQAGTGFVSGLIYGATNTGVQIIAYLDSRDLEREKFVGMIGLSMIAVSIARLGVASYLGFFRGFSDIYLTSVMALSGVLAVYLGRKLSGRLEPDKVEMAAELLLIVIGVRLLTSGLGIV